MIGTFQGARSTQYSFGEQMTTIDGQEYLTWYDVMDPNLRGLDAGVSVEFDAKPGPTVLCHYPRIEDARPTASLRRVVKGSA